MSGYFEYSFLLIFIICFHELGHLLVASFFNINSSHIDIYFFGGITSYDTDENIPLFKEMLILIGGPLFQVLLIFLVSLFNKFIPLNTLNKFMYLNKLLFKFNLLPIINLDGGRFLNLILNYFFNIRTSFIISIIVSFLFLKDAFIFNSFYLNLLLAIFLIKSIIKEIKNYNFMYNKFLLERYLNDYNFSKNIIIKDVKNLRRNRYHNFFINNSLVSEKSFLKNYFKLGKTI